MAGRPVGFALALVASFVVAVLLGRLILTGGEALLLALLGAAVVTLVLARLAGLPAALVVAVAFILVMLASRSLLADPRAGWIVFLLVPVAAVTVALAASVVRALTSKSGQKRGEEGKEKEAPSGAPRLPR